MVPLQVGEIAPPEETQSERLCCRQAAVNSASVVVFPASIGVHQGVSIQASLIGHLIPLRELPEPVTDYISLQA